MALLIGIMVILLSYLFGSIPSAYIIGSLKGVDLASDDDDGRLGASLSFHKLGPVSGIVVGLMDLAKGITAVVVARVLGMPSELVLLAGLAAVAGHNWSVFLGFKGGRGTMVSYGVLISLAFWSLFLALAVAGIFLFFTHKSTLATVIVMSLLSIMLWAQSTVRFWPALPWEPEITPWVAILPVTLLIPNLLKYVQIRDKEYLSERRHAPAERP